MQLSNQNRPKTAVTEGNVFCLFHKICLILSPLQAVEHGWLQQNCFADWITVNLWSCAVNRFGADTFSLEILQCWHSIESGVLRFAGGPLVLFHNKRPNVCFSPHQIRWTTKCGHSRKGLPCFYEKTLRVCWRYKCVSSRTGTQLASWFAAAWWNERCSTSHILLIEKRNFVPFTIQGGCLEDKAALKFTGERPQAVKRLLCPPWLNVGSGELSQQESRWKEKFGQEKLVFWCNYSNLWINLGISLRGHKRYWAERPNPYLPWKLFSGNQETSFCFTLLTRHACNFWCR